MSGPRGCCLDRRLGGVLLHVSSLPGPAASGTLGPDAFRFVDFLAAGGIGVWQMLPIGPTGADGSPYQSSSVHAGSARLVSLEPLAEAGWLTREQARGGREDALALAWRGFLERADEPARRAFDAYCREKAGWLDDFALFTALREGHRSGWWAWPWGLRDREAAALEEARVRLRDRVDQVRFEQFVFHRQWHALKAYANARGVKLFGDMPIFIAHDSAEVWAHPELFALDHQGLPTVVAGVPPDYFSATGQRWGNPLYRWEVLEADGFRFWVDRFSTQLAMFDLIRIDHFRGFEAYWEIPASEPNAVHGRWIKAPGFSLFERLRQVFDPLPVVAEDLGVITPEVEALRDQFGLPGMKILQFAFSGGAGNPYLPFHHPERSVVYTGTHDNDTTLGWYAGLCDGERQYVDDYLGHSREPMPWPLIRCALGSSSRLAVVPMQDLLGLGREHRMNMPGTNDGNWGWRFEWSQLPADLAPRLRHLLGVYGRLPHGG